jgi:hypothetical protein
LYDTNYRDLEVVVTVEADCVITNAFENLTALYGFKRSCKYSFVESVMD